MIGALHQQIHQRVIDLHKNFDMGVFGDRGDGKTMGGINIACGCSHYFNTPFNVDSIHFRPRNFLKQVDDIVRDKLPHEVPPGIPLVMDEAGRGMDAQRWWDKYVKKVADEMETYRTYRFVTIFTCPSFKNITSRARGMLTGYIKPHLPRIPERRDLDRPVTNIKRSINQSMWKFHLLAKDPAPVKGREVIFHFAPRTRDGYLGLVRITKPPASITRLYESKKRAFLDEERGRNIDELSEDVETPSFDSKSIAKEVSSNQDYLKGLGGRIIVNWRLIKDDYDLKENDAKLVKARAEAMLNG